MCRDRVSHVLCLPHDSHAFPACRYIPPAEARAATSAVLSTVLVNHVSASAGRTGASFVASLPTTYEIIDNVSKLSPADWCVWRPVLFPSSHASLFPLGVFRSRVVAVFAFGPEWQFKGWSLGKPPGTIVRPVDVFSFGALT